MWWTPELSECCVESALWRVVEAQSSPGDKADLDVMRHHHRQYRVIGNMTWHFLIL